MTAKSSRIKRKAPAKAKAHAIVKPPSERDMEYGIDWTAKAEALGMPFVPQIVKHQYCAFHNVGLGAFYHRKERIKILWPNYQWHRWNDRRLQGVSNYHWVTWMAGGAAGKTTDAGIFGVEYWLQAPDRTAVIVCSTTMKMLRMRIWSQVVHFHQALPTGVGPVGELLDSVTRIRWKQGDDKNGIFGMAVEEGNIEEVVNNLIGIHTERVMLILDEGQGVRDAIMRATNNMAKNPRFDCLIIGNPDSMHSPLVRESEPIDGWDSVVPGETEQWETLGGPLAGNGLCQFFDGRKSPADDSPEEGKRLHWLINKDWVANHLKSVRGNLNDPTFWSQAIGWPPPMGLESTLIDDAILTTFHCKDKAIWTEGFRQCSALDPAFNGGDKAILQFGKYGRSSGIGYDDITRTWSTSVGRTSWIIEGGEWLQVPIDSQSTVPIHYQIMEYVRAQCIQRGIPPEELAIAAAGEGGGLLSIFQKEWSPMVVGVEEGGAPSDRVIDDTGKTAREHYDTRASELCFNVREFALANGIRGLSHEAAAQYSARRTFYRNGKWCAEPKVGSKGRTDEKGRPVKGYKQRLGHSPDHADAFSIMVEHCRTQGAVPNAFAIEDRPDSTDPGGPDYQDEFSEQNYLKGYSLV